MTPVKNWLEIWWFLAWLDRWEFFLRLGQVDCLKKKVPTNLGQGEDEEGAPTTRLNNHCKAEICIKGHDQYLWASNSKESVCGSKIHLRRIWGWWLWRSSPSLLCSPVGKTLQHNSFSQRWLALVLWGCSIVWLVLGRPTSYPSRFMYSGFAF